MGFKLPNLKDINSLSDIGDGISNNVEDAIDQTKENIKDIEDQIDDFIDTPDWLKKIDYINDGAKKFPPLKGKRSTILLNKLATDEWIPVIYGTHKVGGIISFIGVSGDNLEFYHIALVVSHGEIDSIGNVYADDIRADDDKFMRKGTSKYTDGTITATNGDFFFTGTGTSWVGNVEAGDVISVNNSYTYTVGTVSATNSSLVVDGTGTLWLTNAKVGDTIKFNNTAFEDKSYIIAAVQTNTRIILQSPYLGTTGSGKTYTIESVHETPFYYVTGVVSNIALNIDSPYLGVSGSGKTYTIRKSYIKAYKHTGSLTQAADPVLVAAFSSIGYDSTMQGKGIAYLHVKIEKVPSVFSSEPRINCDVRGIKCFDPRTSLTVYTENPSIITRDYATNTRYGKGIPSSIYDDANCIIDANYCDEIVTAFAGGPLIDQNRVFN